MKKILFFGGLLLSAMTFVSCNGDYDDWADPQSNPQEEAVTLPTLSTWLTPAQASRRLRFRLQPCQRVPR